MAFDSEALAERLLAFGADIVLFVDALPPSVSRRHVADQLLRSATSPGANYEEACAAESRADFVHKMQVALKEMREARYWLRTLQRTQAAPHHDLLALIDEAQELAKGYCKSLERQMRAKAKRQKAR